MARSGGERLSRDAAQVSVEDWVDSRRLIGPSQFSTRVGALLEVSGSGPEFDARIGRWRSNAGRLLEALGWDPDPVSDHPFRGGSMLVIGAPADCLYTATEVNEAAWSLSHPAATEDFSEAADRLASARNDERDPAALRVYDRAGSLGKSAFLDEYGVSVGMGCHGRHWRPGEAPDPDRIDWDEVGDIPVVLVTGTNGKTTTSRLLSAMLAVAGRCPGMTSTDAIRIGDEIVERGDFSGPAGARRVLRDPRTEAAVLETARGGLLRRGLAVSRADVAIVTNIAADHLGDGGIDTLEDLARVKFVVTDVLGRTATAVLNADDLHCRSRAERLDCRITWFSLSHPGPERADSAVWAEGEAFHYRDGAGHAHELCTLESVPITLGGAASHNVANAAAATAAAFALGLPPEAIVRALQTFGLDTEDNAGRGTLLELGEIRALVDFGHNPEGISAVLDTARRLCDGRITVVFGQAGDRSDQAIRDLARSMHAGGVDRYVIKEMAEYRRGREPGEVPGLIREELLGLGVAEGRIHYAETETDAADVAYRSARAGDILVLFIHSEHAQVIEHLTRIAA